MIKNSNVKTIILGDEYDQKLRDALSTVLRNKVAIGVEKSWGLAGSQEIETINIRLGNDHITIESETFIGLSITGPEHIVENLSREVFENLNNPRP